jgi:glycosyltransferase involved in cell wall biosynthesis
LKIFGVNKRSAWETVASLNQYIFYMHNKTITINLIQDRATPHNNILIRHLVSYPYIKIKLWYALDQDLDRYPWLSNITHEHIPAKIYGNQFNWSFIKYCLTHSDERYVIVGWANTNTRLLHFLFFLMRRKYNHWTDLPKSQIRAISVKKRLARWAAYKILKNSRSKVFGVGITAINHLKELGFAESRLVNLPIFVDSDERLCVYHSQRDKIFHKYSLRPEEFILSAGSRIVHEKGYDLLINAIAMVELEIRRNLKLIIVGSGSSVPDLERLIKKLDLAEHILLEKWLSINDFKSLIANSDVFVHPARMDTYGGTTLGMALGVPVIGSYGAGAAEDRIQQGLNGFLYAAEDISTLANFIALLYRNTELRRRMGYEALKTAQAWPPSRGVKILIDHTI